MNGGAAFHYITLLRGYVLSVQLQSLLKACRCFVELGLGEPSAFVNTELNLVGGVRYTQCDCISLVS